MTQKETKKQKNWFERNPKYTTIAIYALIVIVVGTALAIGIINWDTTKETIVELITVLSPFFGAVLIAYFLQPIVRRIDGGITKYISKGKHPKIVLYIAILITYIIAISLVVLVMLFVVPQIVQSIKELTGNVPTMYDHCIKWLGELQQKYPDIDTKMISDKLQEMVPDLVGFGTNFVGSAVPMIFSWSVSLVKVLINVLLAIMISVYMIASKSFFKKQFKRVVYALFSEKKGDQVCKTVRECNTIFSAYLLSKALDSLIIGILCFILMSILGLPYAVLLSLVVGVTNMIPYFGPFIGAVPGVLIYLVTDPMDAIIFCVMILVLQQFDGLILGPKLLGQSTGLNPIWVIFAITVGGAYFGVIGMFIGVPVVAVFAHLIDMFIQYRLKGKKIPALEAYEEKSDIGK